MIRLSIIKRILNSQAKIPEGFNMNNALRTTIYQTTEWSNLKTFDSAGVAGLLCLSYYSYLTLFKGQNTYSFNFNLKYEQ